MIIRIIVSVKEGWFFFCPNFLNHFWSVLNPTSAILWPTLWSVIPLSILVHLLLLHRAKQTHFSGWTIPHVQLLYPLPSHKWIRSHKCIVSQKTRLLVWNPAWIQNIGCFCHFFILIYCFIACSKTWGISLSCLQ